MWKILKPKLIAVFMIAAICVSLPMVVAQDDNDVFFDIPTETTLTSVYMLSSTDVWVVGYAGTIIHLGGGAWSKSETPTDKNLNQVTMVSANDGWAVGIDGTILRYDGTSWTAVTSPVNVALISVSMVSSSDGWIVGDQGKILHWDGTSWTEVTSPITTRLASVDMVSATDGWAVGNDGKILKYDGTSWTDIAMHAAIPDEDHPDVGPDVTTKVLLSVFMVDSTHGFAVGQDGAIVDWDGSFWTSVASPTTSLLYSVFANSATDAWAVGAGGSIVRWDGTSWTNAGTPTTSDLRSVFYCDDRGMAVGINGMTITMVPGTTTWIPEFPTSILVLLLVSLTSIAVILARTASKHTRN